MRQFVAAALAVLGLAACTGQKTVVTTVTRFHTLPAALSGQSFVIADVSAEQKQSPDFGKYAAEVRDRLTHLGLLAAISPEEAAKIWRNPADYPGGELPEPSPPDYVVTLSYGVEGPNATPDGRPRHHRRSLHRQRARRVEIDMYKGDTYYTVSKVRVFEGEALSAGNEQLETVMPAMLAALFQDFPGRSGETRRISIAIPPAVEQHGASSARSQ